VVTRTRWLVVGLAVSLATALTAIGLIVWIAVDPEYWFPRDASDIALNVGVGQMGE
jgi:hypothetical protein